MSAQLKRLPIRTISGKDYYVYQVQPGEGELAIAKKLGIKQQDINKYNPSAAKGLKAYQELLFPVPNDVNNQPPKTQKPNSDVPETYIAEKGESLYGICKKFDISQDDFLKLNPDAGNGIKAGNTYLLKNRSIINNVEEQLPKNKHIIIQGETLYSIAQSNNCSVEELIAFNPGLNPANYHEGQSITIPPKTTKTKTDTDLIDKSSVTSKVKNAFSNRKTYKVKPNETFYSIARNNGISIAQLQDANPEVNILKEGMTLIIPESCDEGSAEASITDNNLNESLPLDLSTGELPIIRTKIPIRMAIALPFNTSVKPHPKHSKNYVDFLKGFMLAIDSLKREGRPVSISIFDTGNNQENFNSILADSSFKASNIIITDNDIIYNNLANNDEVRLLNIFSVRDSSYLTNINVMQANIPTSLLIDLAVKYASDEFKGYTPLILEVKGSSDKLSIANRIASALTSSSNEIKRISIIGTPVSSAFKQLDKSKKYLIIPSTSKPEFAKELLKTLVNEENSQLIKNNVALFGYPEWITIRDKNSIANLKKLNTHIYSRFAEPVNYKKDGVVTTHKHFYGRNISGGVPSMTLTGFDIGEYLINNLEYSNGEVTPYTFNVDFEGIQYPFSFKRIINGGLVNTSAYIIHFTPNGEIENILVKENEI